MPKKIRELKQTVNQSGFILQKRRGKGSHSYWIHPLLPSLPLTIPGKDGDDAPKYLEQQIGKALQALKEI
jgi:predicted RNA binding protein YcfA (HicA-like mRNA interferase family)